VNVASTLSAAGDIIDTVRRDGLQSVLEMTRRFDGIDADTLLVSPEQIRAAAQRIPDSLRQAIQTSITNVYQGHTIQLPKPEHIELGGGTISQRYFPVERVGLYAPGGLAAYASSVIMNVVPAQVAGVGSIAVASPPDRKTGLPSDAVLAACAALGITEVYSMGGAQAIAALAYGLEDRGDGNPLKPVDVITGPGNVYVAAAKTLVRGHVGIDAVAGPTEIMIVADDSADPRFVAADLLSQAEHDPSAACVLVTDSFALAVRVQDEVNSRVAATRNSVRAATALSGAQSAIIVVDNIEIAVSIANQYGAEHLEIITKNPLEVAGSVRNAGAVFIGPWSPVSLGDYAAGSNHVLPTSGTSRFSSGLSVFTFLRPVQFIEYETRGLQNIGPSVVAFAEAEGLPAHGEAVSARLSAITEN
jgi:histidinol dehydrogenase